MKPFLVTVGLCGSRRPPGDGARQRLIKEDRHPEPVEGPLTILSLSVLRTVARRSTATN
jgi:hypothetical protein